MSAGSQPAQNTEITVCIVREVSRRAEKSPTELPPLYHAIDPEALERVVADLDTGAELSFEYAGFEISVSEGPEIRLSNGVESS